MPFRLSNPRYEYITYPGLGDTADEQQRVGVLSVDIHCSSCEQRSRAIPGTQFGLVDRLQGYDIVCRCGHTQFFLFENGELRPGA